MELLYEKNAQKKAQEFEKFHGYRINEVLSNLDEGTHNVYKTSDEEIFTMPYNIKAVFLPPDVTITHHTIRTVDSEFKKFQNELQKKMKENAGQYQSISKPLKDVLTYFPTDTFITKQTLEYLPKSLVQVNNITSDINAINAKYSCDSVNLYSGIVGNKPPVEVSNISFQNIITSPTNTNVSPLFELQYTAKWGSHPTTDSLLLPTLYELRKESVAFPFLPTSKSRKNSVLPDPRLKLPDWNNSTNLLPLSQYTPKKSGENSSLLPASMCQEFESHDLKYLRRMGKCR